MQMDVLSRLDRGFASLASSAQSKRGKQRLLLVASISLNVILLLAALLVAQSKADGLSSRAERREGLLEEPKEGDVRQRLERTEGLLRKMEEEAETLSSALETARTALQQHQQQAAAALAAGAQEQLQEPGGGIEEGMAGGGDSSGVGVAGAASVIRSSVGAGLQHQQHQQQKAWLTIGIPTVPRHSRGSSAGSAGGEAATDYLTRTLETLMDELPSDPEDLLAGQVRVLVMNNAPPGQQHEEFEALKARSLAGNGAWAAKARAFITFLDNPGTVADPQPDLPDPDDLHNPDDRPGRQVRKQTCDLVALLRLAAPLSRYYMFMEDDFEVCNFALSATTYALRKASSLPRLHNWAVLRLSYGLNGLVMHNADLPRLADYLWEHVAVKPPDLLFPEWVQRQRRDMLPGQQALTDRSSQPLPAQEARPYVAYKYNLLSHLGTVSSFAVRPERPAWPRCYSLLSSAWSLHQSERFQRSCARISDLSPCTSSAGDATQHDTAGAEPWLSLPMEWPAGAVDPPAPKQQHQLAWLRRAGGGLGKGAVGRDGGQQQQQQAHVDTQQVLNPAERQEQQESHAHAHQQQRLNPAERQEQQQQVHMNAVQQQRLNPAERQQQQHLEEHGTGAVLPRAGLAQAATVAAEAVLPQAGLREQERDRQAAAALALARAQQQQAAAEAGRGEAAPLLGDSTAGAAQRSRQQQQQQGVAGGVRGRASLDAEAAAAAARAAAAAGVGARVTANADVPITTQQQAGAGVLGLTQQLGVQQQGQQQQQHELPGPDKVWAVETTKGGDIIALPQRQGQLDAAAIERHKHDTWHQYAGAGSDGGTGAAVGEAGAAGSTLGAAGAGIDGQQQRSDVPLPGGIKGMDDVGAAAAGGRASGRAAAAGMDGAAAGLPHASQPAGKQPEVLQLQALQ